MRVSIYLLLLCVFYFCSPKKRQNEKSIVVTEKKIGGFDINHPARKISLPNALEEISGLGVYDPQSLACINDEEGKLYILDIKSEKVTSKIKFGNSGDYEGVEVANGFIYAIKSNGKLMCFTVSDDEAKDEEEFELPFSNKNDIEGLGYEQNKNILLIVSKGSSDTDDKEIEGKAIYGFDLTTNQFLEEPVVTITEEELKTHTGSKRFEASGVAYHPQQKNYYLIASAGKRIIRVNQAGQILETQKIDSDILKQPEGITFGQHGNMFISSEGRGGKGYVMEFKKEG